MAERPFPPTMRGAPPPGVIDPPPAGSENHGALPPGTRLDEFEIVRVLGAGGFGIVYLALDHVLLRYVAVKEYMPTALAGRGKGAMVSVRSDLLAESFALGLDSFFNEARLLASFDHPSLVKVYRFWKANGTAYMVMQYYPGQTLKAVRCEMGTSPNEAWLLAFVEPLLGALEALHCEGVYHRDIAPDNILLLPDGRPVLLDFGSARRVLGDHTQVLTAILKPNFSPVEQYDDAAGMRQGPWTDLYALGATVHYMLTGQAPTPAVVRAVRDAMPALSGSGIVPFRDVSNRFLAAIDWTLALAPDDRPQSIASMRQALSGEVVAPAPSKRQTLVPCLASVQANDDAIFEPTARDAGASMSQVPQLIPEPLPEPIPSVPLRPQRRTGMAALVLMGLGGLCWGAFALAPAAAEPREGTSTTITSTLAQALIAAPTQQAHKAVVELESPLPEAPKTASSEIRDARPTSVRLATAAGAGIPPARPELSPRRRMAAAPSAPTTSDGLPYGPKDTCVGLNFFARAVCVSRECRAPALQARPQCVEARRVEEKRQRRMEQ